MQTTIPDPDFTQLRFVIARAREQRKITQEELAALSGVSRQAILDIGSGKTRGSIETWVRLARALNVSVDELTAPIWGADEIGMHGDSVN